MQTHSTLKHSTLILTIATCPCTIKNTTNCTTYKFSTFCKYKTLHYSLLEINRSTLAAKLSNSQSLSASIIPCQEYVGFDIVHSPNSFTMQLRGSRGQPWSMVSISLAENPNAIPNSFHLGAISVMILIRSCFPQTFHFRHWNSWILGPSPTQTIIHTNTDELIHILYIIVYSFRYLTTNAGLRLVLNPTFRNKCIRTVIHLQLLRWGTRRGVSSQGLRRLSVEGGCTSTCLNPQRYRRGAYGGTYLAHRVGLHSHTE